MVSIIGELFSPLTRRAANVIDDGLTDLEKRLGLKRPSGGAAPPPAPKTDLEEQVRVLVPELVDALLPPSTGTGGAGPQARPWRIYLATALDDDRGPVAVGVLAIAEPRVVGLWRVRSEDGLSARTVRQTGRVVVSVPPGQSEPGRFWEVSSSDGQVIGAGRVSLTGEPSGALQVGREGYAVSFRRYQPDGNDHWRGVDPDLYLAQVLGGDLGGVPADLALGISPTGESNPDQDEETAVIPYAEPETAARVKKAFGWTAAGIGIGAGLLWWLFG